MDLEFDWKHFLRLCGCSEPFIKTYEDEPFHNKSFFTEPYQCETGDIDGRANMRSVINVDLRCKGCILKLIADLRHHQHMDVYFTVDGIRAWPDQVEKYFKESLIPSFSKRTLV